MLRAVVYKGNALHGFLKMAVAGHALANMFNQSVYTYVTHGSSKRGTSFNNSKNYEKVPPV